MLSGSRSNPPSPVSEEFTASAYSRTAKSSKRIRRDEFDQQIGCPRRNPNEMHHQHSVIPEKEHGWRGRGFVRDYRRFVYASALHRHLEDVIGTDLYRC